MQASMQSPATLRRLLVLARDLLQTSELEHLLVLVGKVTPELLHADGGLLLVRAGGREFVTEFGSQGGASHGSQESALLSHARRALSDNTPILLPEIANQAGSHDGAPYSGDVVSLIAYPFPPIKPLGVLMSVWFRKGFREELARLVPVLRSIGELTGAAMGNVRMRQSLEENIKAKSNEIAEIARLHEIELLRRDLVGEEIHRMSVTDMMTGLLNRRGFFVNAEKILKIARRQNLSSAVVFIDIDGLKAVNDAHGHDAGDALIEDVAHILKAAVRDADVVARIGGDEFAAFTIDSPDPEALRARIRRSLAEFSPRPDFSYRIAFSVGIVVCDPAEGFDLSHYLREADRLMYMQKRNKLSMT